MTDQLLQALLLPNPRARQAWDRWRACAEIHDLPYADQQLFPALGRVLSDWLEGDPAAGVIQGIVRMAWSQNQIRLRVAAEADALLKQAGVRPVVAGPLAWSLRTPGPAIRPIPHLTFLVARKQARMAAEAFAGAGWTQHGEVLSDEALDYYDHICFRRENQQIHLHWRLIATRPQDALEFETVCLRRLSSIKWNNQALRTTSPEVSLLHMLLDKRDGDWLAWQADLALVGVAGLDWKRFRKLALRFGPLGIERLQEFRENDLLAIPSLPADDPARLRPRVQFFWDEYRTRSYQRKESVSWLGFAEFLAERWHVRHAWQVPFVAARMLVQQRRSLLR